MTHDSLGPNSNTTAAADNAPIVQVGGPNPVQRKCLLVLGMHRSGTSALTRVLNLLGADLLGNLTGVGSSNEKGHWESADLLRIHEQMLESAGAPQDAHGWYYADWAPLNSQWHLSAAAQAFANEIQSLLNRDLGASALFVVKDPRICRFFGFWHRVLSQIDVEPIIILPIRHPEEVAESLARRDGVPKWKSMLLWLRHTLDAEYASRGLPRMVTSYSNLLADWRALTDAIATRAEIAWPKRSIWVENQIDEFLSVKLRHHVVSESDLSPGLPARDWIRAAYSALLGMIQHGETEEVALSLDNVRKSFDDATKNFAVPIGETEKELTRSGERIAQLEHTVRDKQTALSEAKADLDVTMAEAADREAEAAAENRARDARIDSITATLHELVEAKALGEQVQLAQSRIETRLSLLQASLTSAYEESQRRDANLRDSLADFGKQLEYGDIVTAVREAVRDYVPAGSIVLVASKGDGDLLQLGKRQAWHFPQSQDGIYAGYYPADGHAAINHLEALRSAGADYMLFPQTAFWWLHFEGYADFRRHLDARYPRICDERSCIIYKLGRRGVFTRIRSLSRDSQRAPHYGRLQTTRTLHGSVAGPLGYARIVAAVRDIICSTTPLGSVVVVASKGDSALVHFDGRKGWHFPASEYGGYAGHYPKDSESTIKHLEELRRRGGQFLVFPQPAFWWLTHDHYGGFAEHLKENYRLVSSAPECVIYSISKKLGLFETFLARFRPSPMVQQTLLAQYDGTVSSVHTHQEPEGNPGGIDNPRHLPIRDSLTSRGSASGVDGKCIVYISGEPDAPGHVYRVEMYAAALAAGNQVHVIRLGDVAQHGTTLDHADVLIVWRAAWCAELQGAVDRVRHAGGKVVFDVDDYMFDPALAVTEVIDGIRSQNLAEEAVADLYGGMQQTLLAADYCTCTTPMLATGMRRFGKPTFVLPNGFDERTYWVSRRAAAAQLLREPDGLIRIGYAGGSRTHQKDFASAAPALARVLREHPECRLVLFRRDVSGQRLQYLDPGEFEELAGLEAQVEWREFTPLRELPNEIARFDINLAPLAAGNPFCEAKSELKYFEAAIAGVPTVASPTIPYRKAITHGVTGFLAGDDDGWYTCLQQLVRDPELRTQVARAALFHVLWTYGPELRSHLARSVVEQITCSPDIAARSFEVDLHRRHRPPAKPPFVPDYDIVFEAGARAHSEVAVVVPLYNYAHYVEEALESVRLQSMSNKELIVVNDCSTDESLTVARDWLFRNAHVFTHVTLLHNKQNAGLAASRNAGFAFTDARYVMALDADNILLPECLDACHRALSTSDAAVAIPTLEQFGTRSGVMNAHEWEPSRLVCGNYIDAMALIRRAAWAAAGGYQMMNVTGWEDYELWCRFVELGLYGVRVGEILAQYRVHRGSMLHTTTGRAENTDALVSEIRAQHPWLDVAPPAEPLDQHYRRTFSEAMASGHTWAAEPPLGRVDAVTA